MNCTGIVDWIRGQAQALSDEAVVLAMIEAVNMRDFDALDTLIASDVTRRSGATPGVNVASLDDFKAFLHQDLAGVPDAQQQVNVIFSGGGWVAVHETYRGTQTGRWGRFRRAANLWSFRSLVFSGSRMD